MRKIKEIIIVEGKYDKIKLSQLIDTSIICVDGFRIYHNEKMIALLKNLADTCGVILFTDSDSAGFRIRSYIKNKLAGFSVKHAFIPDIYGKESRKDKPSKEGKLGVEGVSDEIILQSLINCGATFLDEEAVAPSCDSFKKLTKFDLYCLGLSGQTGSAQKREQLLKYLNLPMHMSANMLLDVLNTMLSSGLLKKKSLLSIETYKNTDC